MKFRRISDNSFRCYISQEEMEAEGIDIDDLLENRQRAEEFLHYIIEQAHYEMDFETNGEQLNIQLTGMPDGGIQLMISDDAGAALKNMLTDLKDRLKNFQTVLDEKKEQDKKKEQKSVTENTNTSVKEEISEKKEEQPQNDKPVAMDVWAEIPDFEQCIQTARVLNSLRENPSRLYRYKNCYYLTIHIEKSKKEIAGVAFAIAEFSAKMYAQNETVYEVEEHGKEIIHSKALKVLQNL